MKKDYSNFKNPRAKRNNSSEVSKGSVIVANLSDYEKLPKNVKDHKRESIVVLKDKNKELGVVYLHGKENLDGHSRKAKEEKGLWIKIKKKDQEVYADIDIKVKDAKGNPIKQGEIFQNTGVKLNSKEIEKLENHLYKNKGRKSHSIRNIVSNNKKKANK